MSPSPLPVPRQAQVSSPAFSPTTGGVPEFIYLQDGNQLKAYRITDGGLAWSTSVGYFWASKPVVGVDGTIYVITYDLLPKVGAANFVLSAINPDGTSRAKFNFGRKPTPPLPLPNGLVAIGLSPLVGQQPELQGQGQEPPLATMLGLNAGLQLEWNNAKAVQIKTPLACDGQTVYAADGTNVSAVGIDGSDEGSAPFLDDANATELAAAAGACYAVAQTSLSCFHQGVQAWNVTLPANYLPGSLVADASGCYLRTVEGTLRAFAAADGSQRWQDAFSTSNRLFLALDPSNGELYVLDSNTQDTFYVFSPAGQLLRTQAIPDEALAAPQIQGGRVAWAVSPLRTGQPEAVLVFTTGGQPDLDLSPTETLPQAVINGQSTLNPPWPALQ